MPTGFVVLAKGLGVFRLRYVATGGRRFPSGNLISAKRTLADLERVRSHCDWERGESFWMKAWQGEVDRAPRKLYQHLPYN
jgi:hypothetical protein